ncbi:hypothetical protein D9613_010083 [Agrocybe pediades]|uniref:Gpi anchored protein n=1 Tax=Agrocybe pediades TaxID=84607 RepID=A0A8H4VR12_9AGAR|nr:hypothetical protein D9613_010083 [Agrocybe pediades]
MHMIQVHVSACSSGTFTDSWDPYSAAVVTFEALEGQPIVVVGEFESYLRSIECVPELGNLAGSTTLHLSFDSNDSARNALSTWRSSESLKFVTSHPGCNLVGELGAWKVHTVQSYRNSIEISAEPLPLYELGSYNVAVRAHHMTGVWEPRSGADGSAGRQPLRRETFETGFSKNISGTDILSGDTALDLPEDLQSVDFNITVDLNITLSDLNITALSISTTVNSFDQTVLLGISTNGTLSFSHDRDLFNLPLSGLAVRDLFNIGPEVGVAASVDLDVSGNVNFTTGARASIEPGAFALFDFLTLKESDNGWKSATIQSIPLKVLSGSLSSTATLTISPFIGIGITLPIVNDGQPLVEARISQDAPSIVFAANVSTNVNRDCQPAGDNDFETFAAAYELSADMTFATHIGIVGDLADMLPPWDEDFPHGDFQIFNTSGGKGSSTCFVIVDDSVASTNGSSTPLLTAAPTGTLVAAASAVPSFDISKIESYFSASSQLPPNVNYTQLLQATIVPKNIINAVQKAAQAQATAQAQRPGGNKGSAERLGSQKVLSCFAAAVLSVFLL